jgi:CubicO group peptidase (beta-lactamase class C family)
MRNDKSHVSFLDLRCGQAHRLSDQTIKLMNLRAALFIGGLGLSATGWAQTAAEQTGAAALVEQRIERIRDGLLPPVLVKGEPVKTVTLADRMAMMHVPGVSIAVIHGGVIEWARGFGVTKIGGAPITVDTLFQAASISKPVTALAVLHLVQEGKLNLDADVNQYLKNWKIPANEFTVQSKVTLRELLTHTAGMTVHGFAGYAAGESVPTLAQVLDGSGPANNSAIRVDAIPGKAWRYSGGGYVVIQQVLADMTGRPFSELMQATVLQPIGMTHSTYEQPLPSNRLAEVATPYRENNQPLPGGPHTYPEMAPAGLWTTASDLARYAIEVQESLTGKANHVLSTTMTRAMLTPVLNYQGLGPQVGGSVEHPYFNHGGANEGYRCELIAYENGDGAVVMTNSDSGDPLACQILATIAHEYSWPDFQPPERSIVAVDPKSFDAFTGRYQLGPDVIFTITREGDKLFTLLNGQHLRLFPMSAREFFLTVVDARVAFAPDVQGKSPGLIVNQNGRALKAMRLD